MLMNDLGNNAESSSGWDGQRADDDEEEAMRTLEDLSHSIASFGIDDTDDAPVHVMPSVDELPLGAPAARNSRRSPAKQCGCRKAHRTSPSKLKLKIYFYCALACTAFKCYKCYFLYSANTIRIASEHRATTCDGCAFNTTDEGCRSEHV